jgi:hypothetical protein
VECLVALWVARWFVFKPKIPIWVNFGVCYDGKCWSILWPCGIFNGLLLHFKVIWYILPVLVSCSQKNLATLVALKKNSALVSNFVMLRHFVFQKLFKKRCRVTLNFSYQHNNLKNVIDKRYLTQVKIFLNFVLYIMLLCIHRLIGHIHYIKTVIHNFCPRGSTTVFHNCSKGATSLRLVCKIFVLNCFVAVVVLTDLIHRNLKSRSRIKPWKV